jgi:tetratricopeptide (TPR) repeat protein
MGRKLASQMDYDGAVEAYEKALLVNPQSSAAHFELAWLYEDKENDPAAAIYHYQRFLKLAPGSGKADVAQAHINNCKLELAKTASAIAPISASAQRDLDKLLQENRELKAQLAQLVQQQAYYESHPQLAASNPPVATVASNPVPPVASLGTGRGNGLRAGGSPPSPVADTAIPAPARTYTIVSGDNLAAIARRFGVSLSSLEAANPRVEPTRLRVGSILNIPAH